MSGPKVKPGFAAVTALLASYAFEGVSYGPFQASRDTPYLEVPEALASALNLPRYEDGTSASASRDQDDAPDSGRAMITDAEASATLRADLEAAVRDREAFRSELETARQKTGEWQRLANEQGAKVTDLTRDLTGLTQALEAARQRVTELETQLAEAQTAGVEREVNLLNDLPRLKARVTELEAAGTPLVDGLPSPDLLTAHGFTSMELLEAGLVVAEGESESPVQQVNGIGRKSVEAYQAAVADWRKGQGQ